MKVNGKSKTPITAAQSETGDSGGKKAQASQQASKNKKNGVKSAVLDRISDGILAFDAGMNYTYLNNQAGELLGRRAEELIGKNLRDEYPGVERTPFLEACQRALETQTVVWLDEYFPPTDRWLEGRVYPSKDGVSVLLMEGQASEAGERHLQMRSMFPEQNPAPVMRLTQEGIVLYANPAAASLLGAWNREGKSSVSFLKIQELLPPVIQSNTNQEIEIENEGRVFTCQLVPFPEDGYVNLYFRDVTERKQAEQSLLALVNQTSAGIGQIDYQGRFNFVNQALCEMLGYREAELIGKAYWEITEPDSIEKNKLLIGQMLVKGEPFQREKRLIRKNGSTLWVNVGGSPVREVDGRIPGGTTVFVDISRRKRAEESLLDSARRSLFLSSLSDTIRSIDDSSKIQIEAACLLGAHLKASRAVYVEIETDGNGFIRDNYVDGVAGLNGHFPILDLIPQDQLSKFQAGRTFITSDVQNDSRFSDAQRSAYEALSIQAQLIRPILRGGELDAAMCIQQSRPRMWRDEDVSLLEESAERIQTAVERAEAERKLRQTEERFRQAANASRALVYDVDLFSGATAIVHGMEGLAGFDPQETSASSDWWHSLIHPDDLPTHLAQLDELLENGDMDVCEYRLRHKNGEWIIVQDNRLVIRDEAGKSVRLIGTVIDITGRKKMELELREGERKFNLIFNKLPFTAVLARSDDGILVNVNEEFEHVFGYARQEAIGHTTAELGIDTRQQERMQVLEELQASLSVRNMELELVTRPHGPRVFLINTDLVNAGGIQFVLQTAQDITERKQAEGQLRAKEAELEEIIHQTPFMLTRCTRDLRYRFVSRAYAEMIGRTPEQVVGKSILEIMGQEGLATIRPYIERVLQGEQVEYESEVPFHGVHTPGLHVIYTPDRDPEGNVIGWFASIVDITERKQHEQQLAEFARQQQALYVLADQLNNTRSLEEVFNPALDAILDALQCDRASILLYDDENVMRFVAWRGLSDAYRRATDGHSPWTPDAKNPEPLYIDNIDTSDQEEALKAVIRKEGISSLAFIPMVSNGRLIGKFTVYFNALHTFTGDELEFGLTIARQLASSVERNRAEEQLRKSAEFDAFRITLADALRSLNDPHKIQAEATRILGEKLQVDRVFYGEVVDEAEQVTVISDNYVKEGASKITGQISMRDYGKAKGILHSGKNLIIPDVKTSSNLGKQTRAALAERGILSGMGAPMIKEGHWVAIFGVLHSSIRKWTKEEVALLEETAERTWTALERARAQEALRSSEALYRTIARSIPGGGVYVVDKDFRYRVAEGPVTEAFGLSTEMLEGHTVSEIFHGEHAARLEARLRQNFAGETLNYETENNGRIYWTQQAPLPDSFGQAIIVTMDITEQKKAEEALRVSEQRMRLAIEANRMVAWEWDPAADRVTTSSNMPEVYGVSGVGEAAQGFSMIWAEDLPAHREKVDRVTRYGGEYHSEFRITRPVDGRIVWMEERARALTDEQGQVTRLVGIVTDITERKRAEEALRESEERFTQFMQYLPGLAWIKDAGGRYMFANAAAEKAFNIPREQLYGKTDQDVFPAEVAVQFKKNDDEALMKNEGVQVVEMLPQDDGVLHYSLVTKFPIPALDGSLAMIGGTAFDITERVNMESALQNAREQAEQTADRMARLQDITASLAGSVTAGQLADVILEQGTQATDAAAGILVELVNGGRDLKTIASLGFPPDAVRTEYISLSTPTPLSDAILEKQAVWLESQEEYSSQYPQMAQVRRKLGHEAVVALPLIVGEQVMGGLVFSFTGKRGFLLEERGLLLAIAQQCAQALERVRAEEAVRESQQRLALTYNHAAIGLVETSPDAHMIQCNGQFCRILGYSREELTRHYISDITFEEDNRIERGLYQQLMAGQIPFYRIEKRFVRKDGSLVWCEVVRSVVLDNTGKARFGIGAVFDINERRLKEEALRARTEEIETLMEVSPIGILVAHDPECNYITGNPAVYTLLGMPADSHINLSKSMTGDDSLPFRVLRDGVELAVTDLPMQTAARLGMEIEEESLEFVFEDGTQKYIYTFAKPLFDSHGGTRGVIAAMLDITERMRMVQSLQDSEERFAKAFRVSPDAVIISRLADSQILEVNNSWTTLFGYEMQEAVGKTSLELNLFANQEDRNKVVNLLREQGYVRDFELDVRRKSGELRRVILAIESIEISGVDCLISILHDVTDRRHAQEALRDSEERHRALVNQATAGIVRKDPKGKILFVNQAFCNMLDQVDSELVGKTMWELTHEEDIEQNQRLYHRLMAEGIPFRLEKRLMRRDGSFLWVNVSVSPVMDLTGRPQSAVSVYVDINQRKLAESRLTLLTRTSEIIREYEDPEELMYAISRVVGEHFLVRRALFDEIDIDRDREVVHRDYCREVISVAGEHKLTDYSSITTAEMMAGKTVVNHDSRHDPRTAVDYERSYVPYGERAYVAVPLMHEERWVASLWISDDKPRQWDEDDVRLLETIAERTWTAAEKLRIDRALRESEERLRITINTTAVGFAALSPDTHFEEMNDAFCRMAGYSREQLLGMDWEMLIHPDYIRSTKDHLEDLMSGRIPSFDIEKLYVQGDGSEIWMQNSVSLIRDAEGNPAQLILIGLDITDRVRTERALHELNLQLEERVRSRTAELQSAYEALRTNEEKLRTLFEILPVGISFLDKDGGITEINNALIEIMGLSRKEILAERYKSRRYIRSDGTPMPPSEFASTRVLTEQKTIYNVETGIVKENGEIAWTSVNAAPVQVADVEAAVVTVDITERKLAEDALQKNRERLRVLSRRLVEVQEEERRAIARELHDRVGQNLAALTLNLNILRNQLSAEALDKVGTRLNDSVTLVKDILTITRSVMADLRPNVLDDYGLDAALNEYADRFMQRYGIRVITQMPKKPVPRVDQGVEMTLLRIAQEALTNVARHSQASQAVLSLEVQNDALLMMVEDNGLGILSWQRVNQPGSHGLRIMRERAEAFGGYLKVHSTYKNGTKIEVKIPIASTLPGNSSKEKRS